MPGPVNPGDRGEQVDLRRVPTVGSRINSSTPASWKAAMTSLIASGERWALEATISAVSGPRIR